MEACHVGDRTQAGTQRHHRSADADGLHEPGGAGRSLDGPAHHVRQHRRGHGHRVYRQRRRESHQRRGGEPVLAYPRCDEDRLCDEDLGAGGWRTPGRAPAGSPIGLRSGHAGQRAGHHRFLIVRGIPERPVPPGAGPPYLWRRRQCAGPPRLRAAERSIDRLDIPSPAGGAQRHGACGRDLLRQRAGPKPPALGHFREPHLFG